MSASTSLKAATTLGGALLLALGLSVQTASAGIPTVRWDATDTVADVVGAHAWGATGPGPVGDTYTVTVNIKDTKADSHGARVNIRAASADGSVTLVSVSASGEGVTAADSFTLWGPVTVQECLTEQGVDYVCGEPYRIV
ncbi:hypothetical protein [Streptomyces sp. UH6]|uniref:hypothetical protein n=1 Tax=Streptomyces sp. UH6 TaxID=2748379 RepID=UPI0015D4E033|nr:hypothetical protein [Streptomyces sp. UH6]NYV73417.1 hypothetical protein [Streptomyces sp. UH6]